MIGPVPSGASYRNYTARDLEYVRDSWLGRAGRAPRIANSVDPEVVLGELTYAPKKGLPVDCPWHLDE